MRQHHCGCMPEQTGRRAFTNALSRGRALHEWRILRQVLLVAVHRTSRPDRMGSGGLGVRVSVAEMGAPTSGCVRFSSQPLTPCMVQSVASQVRTWLSCTPAVVGGLGDLRVPPFHLIQLCARSETGGPPGDRGFAFWPRRLWFIWGHTSSVSAVSTVSTRGCLESVPVGQGVLGHLYFRSLRLSAWLLSGRRGR